jgi:hypothetical protein
VIHSWLLLHRCSKRRVFAKWASRQKRLQLGRILAQMRVSVVTRTRSSRRTTGTSLRNFRRRPTAWFPIERTARAHCLRATKRILRSRSNRRTGRDSVELCRTRDGPADTSIRRSLTRRARLSAVQLSSMRSPKSLVLEHGLTRGRTYSYRVRAFRGTTDYSWYSTGPVRGGTLTEAVR